MNPFQVFPEALLGLVPNMTGVGAGDHVWGNYTCGFLPTHDDTGPCIGDLGS